MLIFIAALPIAIWIFLLIGRNRFWWIEPFKLTPTAAAPTKRIAVIIPARDEAESIVQVIAGWQAQNYDGPLRVFIIDDHSSDGTAAIAQNAIENSTRFQLLSASDKPAHWTGKLWAMSCGIEATRDFTPDYFLFTDADILHAPDTLHSLIAHAERGPYDLVSLMVRLHCTTLPEKALIPAFVFFFFLLYPPRAKFTGAAGGCMLVSRASLERAGGLDSIRDALIDDCALAAAIQRSGGRVYLAPADQSYSLRVYRTFGEIGRMISRTAFTQLHYSPVLLAATVIGLFVTYLLPLCLGAPGLVAWLLMSAAYAPTVRYYRLSPFWSLTLPAIALFYAGATLHSALRYWQGRGGEWKGRTLP